MISLADRRGGMVWGALVGDSLALGPHWIYEPEKIGQIFGILPDLAAPATTYHPGKVAGAQTHYGDQTLVLLRFLRTHPSPPFNLAAFARAWRDSWVNSTSYRDHATKDTLEHMNQGGLLTEAGSNVPELGGASRIAPLLAAYGPAEFSATLAAVREQTRLTHPPVIADAAELIARTVHLIWDGSSLFEALEKTVALPYPSLEAGRFWDEARAVQDLPPREALSELGLSCDLTEALPATFFFLLKNGSSLETALRENALAGGDSAARGLVIGTILGTLYGLSAIPEAWKRALQARILVEQFIQGLAGGAS